LKGGNIDPDGSLRESLMERDSAIYGSGKVYEPNMKEDIRELISGIKSFFSWLFKRKR